MFASDRERNIKSHTYLCEGNRLIFFSLAVRGHPRDPLQRKIASFTLTNHDDNERKRIALKYTMLCGCIYGLKCGTVFVGMMVPWKLLPDRRTTKVRASVGPTTILPVRVRGPALILKTVDMSLKIAKSKLLPHSNGLRLPYWHRSCDTSGHRDHSLYAPSQWETALHCNIGWVHTQNDPWDISSVEYVEHQRKVSKSGLLICVPSYLSLTLFFKIFFLMLFTFLHEISPIQWLFGQHCGCWWTGALAPGYQ